MTTATPPSSNEAPLAPVRSRAIGRYVVAVALVAVAVTLEVLPTQIGQERAFPLLNGAIIVAAWWGGRGPALVALAVAALAADYYFLPPAGFAMSAGSAVELALFVAEASVTGALVIATKEARERAEVMAQRGQRAEEQLLRLNQAHRALTTCNEALVRADDDRVLLEEICRAIIEVAGYRMCWVGLAEHDAAKTVRPVAQAGFDEGYVAGTEITWADGERGRGPVGTAIRTKKPFVHQDVATHPAFGPWRAEAQRRGYASVIALPLLLEEERVLGALAIYAAEADAFRYDAVKLLTELASDLAFGLRALRLRRCVRAERARFERVIMQAPVAVAVLTGPEHRLRLVNPRWSRLGLTDDAALGKPLAEAAPDVVATALSKRIEEMRATAAPCDAMEEPVAIRGPDGAVETRFYNVAGQPMTECPDGAVGDIILSVTDVTEQVAARRALEETRAAAEQASRAKDEFLRVISHELRTPLTPILWWAQALKRAPGRDPRQIERGLDVILTGARAQARLIDDLLDVSEIVAGRLALDAQPIEIGSIVAACVEEVRPEAQAKGIALDASIAPEARLVGDASRLRQVVCHLLSNAIKFTPRGGRVDVDLVREPSGRERDTLTLRVRDTGKGIARGRLALLFETFTSGDGSLTRAEGGLGLGLFIARHIVERHGGTIRAESDGPNRGATFVVQLEAS